MNMKKLCVGILSIEQLIASNDRRSEPDHPKTGEDFIYITTRSRPQKWESMVNGGSLYWIIDRRLCCRQEIIDFREGNKQEHRKGNEEVSQEGNKRGENEEGNREGNREGNIEVNRGGKQRGKQRRETEERNREGNRE